MLKNLSDCEWIMYVVSFFRFYEESTKTPDEEKGKTQTSTDDDKEIVIGTRKHKIKSRGRGTKRLKSVTDMLYGTGSMAADREDLE